MFADYSREKELYFGKRLSASSEYTGPFEIRHDSSKIKGPYEIMYFEIEGIGGYKHDNSDIYKASFKITCLNDTQIERRIEEDMALTVEDLLGDAKIEQIK